jgi:hypothetical protein
MQVGDDAAMGYWVQPGPGTFQQPDNWAARSLGLSTATRVEKQQGNVPASSLTGPQADEIQTDGKQVT